MEVVDGHSCVDNGANEVRVLNKETWKQDCQRICNGRESTRRRTPAARARFDVQSYKFVNEEYRRRADAEYEVRNPVPVENSSAGERSDKDDSENNRRWDDGIAEEDRSRTDSNLHIVLSVLAAINSVYYTDYRVSGSDKSHVNVPYTIVQLKGVL